jgi:hypothetical protein
VDTHAGPQLGGSASPQRGWQYQRRLSLRVEGVFDPSTVDFDKLGLPSEMRDLSIEDKPENDMPDDGKG